MPSQHTTAMLTEFAWALGALAFLGGIIWVGAMFEWTRPWIIGWMAAAILFGPVLTMMFFSASRDEEERD